MTKEETTADPFVKRIGRYLLRYLVAQGGMASVYLAQLPGPEGFEKWVAVKVIHPHLARSKRFVQMFLNEARIAARIHHPNVCSVIDFGFDEKRKLPYLVMEYLHGETFSNALRRTRKEDVQTPQRTMVRIIVDAARGLHAAHEIKRSDGELLGVVHRDISPQNVFVLYEGHSKVLDFGIAKLRDTSTDSKSGEIKGKLSYMSPEQFRNEKLDRRSDVWALGVVAWEATVGHRLFETENQGSLVYSVLEEDIPLPSAVAKSYPPELEKVVMKALERDLDKRYQTAAAFASDLETYLYSEFDPAGPEQVGQWMSGIFADRLAARNVLLRSQDIPIGTVPQVDFGVEDHGRMSLEGVVEVGEESEGRFKPTLPQIVVASVAVLALLLLVVAWSPWSDDSSGDLVAENRTSPPGSKTSPTQENSTAPDAATSAPDVAISTPDVSGTKHGSDGSPDAVASVDPEMDFSVNTVDSGAVGDAEVVLQQEESPPDETKVATSTPQVTSGPATRPEKRPEKRSTQDPHKSTKREPRPHRSTGGQRGKLSLMAIPPAEVHVGGRSLGRTPLFNVELPPGRHRLRLRALDGSGSKTITVQIRAGQVVRRSVRL